MDNAIYGYIYRLKLKKDNRCYIGQTTYDPYKYFKDAYVNHKGGQRRYLANAIKKYGINMFDFEILESAFNKKELDDLEKFYIIKYNSRNKKYGFNLKEGGSFGKHSIYSKNKMSKSRIGKNMGLDSPRALISTIKNKISGQEDVGCMSELARKHEFNIQSMSRDGKSKNWELIKLTTKTGEECELPVKPKDMNTLRGLANVNAKIATIHNIETGCAEIGCISELARKYNFCGSQLLCTGKCQKWRLIKLTTKDGIECQLPEKTIDRDTIKGSISCRAKIATIRNIETGYEEVGCISELARKYKFHRTAMSSRGKSKGWILIKLTTKDGIECELPNLPIDKNNFNGLLVHNAKIATVKNLKTGEEIKGCASQLSKKYNFNSDKILQRGKSKGWILIKLTTKDGIECQLPNTN